MRLSGNWKMSVFTARYDLGKVEDYLIHYGLGPRFTNVTNVKPKADVYLDDKALRFTTWDQALQDLRRL